MQHRFRILPTQLRLISRGMTQWLPISLAIKDRGCILTLQACAIHMGSPVIKPTYVSALVARCQIWVSR